MMPALAAVVIAIESVESGGRWWVENGGCVGVMQIDPRWSIHSRAALFDPNVNRQEGRRILNYWLRRSRGDLQKALAAYNCGNAGLRGECGKGYARRVLRVAKVLTNRGAHD